MKLYDKVLVKINKSSMNSTLVVVELTVCGFEKDENGVTFYRGWTNKGKVRYFRIENIVK